AACTSVVFVSATSLTCMTPAGTAGARNVVVTNPDLGVGTGTGAFTYLSSSGGGGGGGSSSTPLAPIPPGSNPNIPTSGVPLGDSVLLLNGEPKKVVVRPDAPKDAKGIDVEGDGFTMKLAGLGADGQPLGLTSDGALILQQDRTAAVEGTGFLPNSDVNLYTFSTPRFLGTVKTDASGTFKGTVPLPMDIPAGRHTLQSNGLAPDGAVRSLSLGVLISKDKVRTAKATLYFESGSFRLDATAKASLSAAASKIPKSATIVSVRSIGYVQRTAFTSNDLRLSKARAVNAAAFLKRKGVRGMSSVAVGRGVAKESGSTARRVEVVITYTVKR
ncbi:MAG: OmpA family protein, partial [Candidatus Nanopelagicales bacterium]|nr:OmpA family protein [Candidatus Nanopelagicales bacterium]